MPLNSASTWTCTCTCKVEKYLYLTQVLLKALDLNPNTSTAGISLLAPVSVSRGRDLCHVQLHRTCFEQKWSLLQGNEMWGANASDLQWLHHNARCVVVSWLWYQRLRQNTQALGFTIPETWHWGYYGSPLQLADQMVCTCTDPTYQIQFVTDLRIPSTSGRARARKTSRSPILSESVKTTECQKHSHFMYLIQRPEFIAPHKTCLIEGGRSWRPFINTY